jgi:hypothetical protein
VCARARIADLNARAYVPVTRVPRAGRERPADERAQHALYIETPRSSALVADQSIAPALEQYIQNLNAENQAQHQYIKLLESEFGAAGEIVRAKHVRAKRERGGPVGSVLKVVCNTGNDARTEACAVICKHSKLRAQKQSQAKVCALCTRARGRTHARE